MRILGWVLFICGPLWAAVAAAIAISKNDELALTAAFATGLELFVTGAGLVIAGELIMVLLDIESNTRRMR